MEQNCYQVPEKCPQVCNPQTREALPTTTEEIIEEDPVCCVRPQEFCEPQHKKLERCECPNQNQLCTDDGIIITAKNPEMCVLGDRYPLEFNVRAKHDVTNVKVTTILPQGVTYLCSDPEATVNCNKLTWEFGHMQSGDCINATVTLLTESEGELCASFYASAEPMKRISLLCAKPVLLCHQTGPAEVCPGESVTCRMCVTNKGSCAAEDVILTDHVPDGLEHCTKSRTLTYNLGCIEPGKSKSVDVTFTAVKKGQCCNTIVVSSSNADISTCECTTSITSCDVDLMVQGPKEHLLGKYAEFSIHVTNSGDKPLNEVTITDWVAEGTSIVKAEGACINGNQVVWRMKQMLPGEKACFFLSLTSCTPGCFYNKVYVDNCEGCRENEEFITRWRGLPALNVSICDTVDPICVGEPTSYIITISNQGSEPDSDVKLMVKFPPEIVPVSASGDSPATIIGDIVTFEPYDNFGPRHTTTYRIDARAASSGHGRITAEVTSKTYNTPLIQQESTYVH